MPGPVNVFVSYSWAVEQDTGIVDELETLCVERNIRLLRDSKELKHGDPIRRLMDQLAGGEHIITVFSKAYFRSKWCMYELLETWHRRDFLERTHPIIADDCDLQDDAYRIGMGDYWVAEHEKLKALLESRAPALYVKEHERANILRDISQNVNELMNFAAGRVTTPLDQLKAASYAPLLDRIQSSQSPAARTEAVSDETFLAEVRQYIESDLKKSEKFREQVAQDCAVGWGEQPLHEYLIQQCLTGEFVPVIQRIQSAFVDCFDLLDEEKDIGALHRLHQAAEGMVSKLVLFNVKNEWMEQYRQVHGTRGQREHVLPMMSFSGVEVVSSREARTIPKFHMDRNSFDLQGGKGVALERGFRPQTWSGM